MSLSFEQGNQEQPRGHAILYFRSPSEVVATYIIVLPLQVDFTKYIPPLMANQVKDAGLEQFSAFAMPPVPESVISYQALEELARTRGDDLIYGGDIPADDFMEAAQRVNEAVQSYAQIYREHVGAPQDVGAEQLEAASTDLSVGEVVYSLMSEQDKLSELTKLVGKTRFAVEGKDTRQLEETEAEMRTLARHLPESFQVPRLIEAARLSLEQGPRLAELYLERCYKLRNEDYLGLKSVEEAILELQHPTEHPPKTEEL